MAKDNDHKKRHNLWTLFESLNEIHKSQIYSNVEIPKEQLEDLIKSHDKVFEEWRYIYELDYSNVNLDFLRQFQRVIEEQS